MYKKKRHGIWYQNPGELFLFAKGARDGYPDLKHTRRQSGLTFRVTVPVTGYDSRKVRVYFPPVPFADFPRIYADVPETSPHRYADGSLCVWHPKDPEDRRWIPQDGLLELLDLVAVHLFKEAWWRDTDRWLGSEAPHGQIKSPDGRFGKERSDRATCS